MKEFADRVAIVTGGASGIGRALCEELARRRAIVVVADLNGEEALAVAQGLTKAGGSAWAAPVDVSSQENLESLVREVIRRHGRIDLMFNNAGIGWSGDFREMPATHTDRVVGINLLGVLHGTAAVYRHMVERGSGHIVNTSSFFSGLVPVPGMSVYTATKHAIVGFSLALRDEARSLGVDVSVVCPSFIRSNIDANSDFILRGRSAPANAAAPRHTLDAAAVARRVLSGISRNQAVIIMPSFARLLWWLYRAAPRLFLALQRSVVMGKKLRRRRRSKLGSALLAPARWLYKVMTRGARTR